jgi:putative membrane protein
MNNKTISPEVLEKEKKYKTPIILVSIIIPIAVAALFGIKIEGVDLSFLPPVYASINGLTAVVLVLAVWAIKNKKQQLHENLIRGALFLSVLFLLMYVAYHITSEATPYGGEGFVRYLYFFILISHIVLSIGIIPLVLFTFLKGFAGNYQAHKKLAKFAFPLWLYVAVTGVVVYFMISPYYV